MKSQKKRVIAGLFAGWMLVALTPSMSLAEGLSSSETEAFLNMRQPLVNMLVEYLRDQGIRADAHCVRRVISSESSDKLKRDLIKWWKHEVEDAPAAMDDFIDNKIVPRCSK